MQLPIPFDHSKKVKIYSMNLVTIQAMLKWSTTPHFLLNSAKT